ncbi:MULTISPECIES: hypothetical protein [Agrobacterium]|uniref:hypothetical protein n=1 Tax=Agrobacterium TaxID=357 RepID=UPI001571D7A6|nr:MULTISPECIES: hypothetical protein [Agrobacterium]NTJ44156.1 hypothetical protein [Agrobacterium larrymoorei]WCK22391.1 hypothetical protein G6M09_025600 [Agrobacterium tumefaciens]
MKFASAASWIAVFSVAGYTVVKLTLAVVCWVTGHDLLEAIVGSVASIALGAAIGVESFLWLRDWLRGRSVLNRHHDCSHLPTVTVDHAVQDTKV